MTRGPTASGRPLYSTPRGADLADALFSVPADPHEVLGVESRAADQRAVDVRLGHDPGRVGALDRAAVENPDGVRQVAGELLGEPGSDRGADLLSIGRRGHLAGADGPDR